MDAPLLVLVEWEDASVADDGTWVSKKDLPEAKPVIFQQAGWLLEWTEQHLLLTEALGDELMAARNRIPAGMVRAVYTFPTAAGKRLKRR